MGVHLPPGHPKHRRKRDRLSRHASILILMLVLVAILALCGRSVSAQLSRSEELIESALALEPDTIEGRRGLAGYAVASKIEPLDELR